MKKKKIFQLSLLIISILTFVRAEAAEMPEVWTFESIAVDAVGGWEKLGSKKVNYGLDRDEIRVTARDGRFSKLKLKVKKGGINMHKMVVHFGNGETQNVAMRNNIPRGGESRVIDLNGGKRVVSKVVFWYDTKNMSRKRARLELWGRH